MKQQIRLFLREVGEICWLLLRTIVGLAVKGTIYIYKHRIQIMQHKVTVPVLIVLSVVWTGLSSFSNVSRDNDEVASQAEIDYTYIMLPTQESSIQVTEYNKIAENDSNLEEPFQNTRLVAHIMDWVGTPHKDNKQSKNGTDCSGFVQAVFQDAHGIELSRSSKAMYENDVQKVYKSQLQEGDLVFFNTFGKDISHVGIYLKDGKFAHTSTSRGVTVSSLQDKYYQQNYRGAGRVKDLIN